MAPETHDGEMKTPMGVFTLDFAFGTAPNPGGGLQYVQVGSNHWWDGDMKSPTYNTMQVCEKRNARSTPTRPAVPRTSTSRSMCMRS